MKIRPTRSGRRRLRRGFSLTEVMVAMTMLSIVLMSLARITFQMAASGRLNDTVAKRNAVLVQEANKFNAMAFDSLATVSTTTRTLTFGDFTFSRRLTITSIGTQRKTIKIVLVPEKDTTRKDSVFVHRSKPTGSPLCVGC